MSKITINNLEIDIKDLKKQLSKEQLEELNKEEVKSKVFVPQKEVENYWFIYPNGDVDARWWSSEGYIYQEPIIKNNLVYFTQEEAEEALIRNQARTLSN